MFRPRSHDDFEAAFARLYPRATRVAWRLLRDPLDAQDAAAEAFTRLLLHWPRVRDLDHLDAWVMRVTANIAIDDLRRRHRGAHAALVVPVDDLADEVVTTLDLRTVLTALSKRQRDVIVLRYVADLTERDVALCLGVGQETVKEHSARALKRLRALADGSESGRTNSAIA